MTQHPAAPAGTTCPACGTGTPVAARFCPACGQRLLGEVEERRVVTMLFADLVDSTRLVASLDPEAARDLLNETFRRLAAEVRRLGGTPEKSIGDAIFVVFSFPTGHDDDAARAVRAALLGLSPAEPATGPMVGREADLPRLVGALDHAAHHNRLVLLVGDAGVGKSTLARAATAEIGDRVHVLWGRCLPVWPVREVLAAAAGLAPTEPAGVLSTSIHRLGADTWPDPVAAPVTAESLCRLAALEVDEPGPAAQPGPGTTRELAAAIGAHALARRLAGAGAAGPGRSRTGGGMAR